MARLGRADTGIHLSISRSWHGRMRARHRDLVNASSSMSSLCNDQNAGGLARRFASAAQQHWEVSHPIAYWRADGSVYAGRIAPRSSRGWFSGFLLPLSLLGITGAGVYRYGRPDSPAASPEAIAKDVKEVFTSGVREIYSLIRPERSSQATSGSVQLGIDQTKSSDDAAGVVNLHTMRV